MKTTTLLLAGLLGVATSLAAATPETDARTETSRPPRRQQNARPGGERGDGGDRSDPGGPPRGRSGYSIEQAISDRAQLHTLAFDGLAFLTGNFGACTFLPPGKAADFFGFQYMRDIDAHELGHNTSFVPLAANNVLHLLTEAQKAQLIELGREQEKLLAELAHRRFPLIQAFCRLLAGDLPAGTDGLDPAAVRKQAAEIFEIDGVLSYQRARVVGGIVRSLTDEQKAYLAKLSFDDSSTWPELADQVDKRSLPHGVHVAVMTYASEMLSWYAGSVEADVYFCPERHATYFGSFYLKDIPAMGNANFSISTSLTGDSGEAFLAALTDTQRPLITGLVDEQRAALREIVEVRRAIAIELRRFMKEESADEKKVMALARRYGELDGDISYGYATRFTAVARSLSPEQKAALLKLRNLDARYETKGAYLYSRPIPMPEVPSTDSFFTKGAPAVPIPSVPTSATARAGTTPGAAPAVSPTPAVGGFVLRSPAFPAGASLPVEYTGDGAGQAPPLEWTEPPAGTRSLALVMHHLDPEGKTKWYWTLYDLPPTQRHLPAGAAGIGTLGNNSVNGRTAYAPPHSRGPGEKKYILTLYALSDTPHPAVPAAEVTRDVLLAAMKGHILATAELPVTYTRGDSGETADERRDPTANAHGNSTRPEARNPANPANPAAGSDRSATSPGARPRPRNPLVEALDQNGDGTLDADEIAAAAASLKKLDANGDGSLSPDEYRPPRPEGGNGPDRENAAKRDNR